MHSPSNTDNQEKIIREYFKRKYDLNLTEEDYQEISQSLHFLGKAIYRSLQFQNKGGAK